MVVSWFSNVSEQAKNFARVLRPVLLIERLRNVRKITTSILSTVPEVAQILLLLTFWVSLFGVGGFTLFAGVTGSFRFPHSRLSTHRRPPLPPPFFLLTVC